MTIEEKADKKSFDYNTKFSEDGILKSIFAEPHRFREGVIEGIVNILRSKAYSDGYIAGAKENGTVWHDLRKDPNDLPEDTYDVLDQAGYKVHYNFFQNVWVNEKDEIDNHVIAWCEIPQF